MGKTVDFIPSACSSVEASHQGEGFPLCTVLISLHPATHHTVHVCSSTSLLSSSARQPREVVMTCIPLEASGNSLTSSTQGGILHLALGLLFNNWQL